MHHLLISLLAETLNLQLLPIYRVAIKKRAYHDYRIVVSRQERRPHAELYPFGLTDPIPPFAVPLKPGSAEPLVEIDRLLQTVIDRAGLSVVLDYQTDPSPALPPDGQAWLQEVLEKAGYR